MGYKKIKTKRGKEEENKIKLTEERKKRDSLIATEVR